MSAARSLEALSNALDPIYSFSPNRPEWGVTDLARHLGLSKASVHPILTTCVAYGLIERTSERQYKLPERSWNRNRNGLPAS